MSIRVLVNGAAGRMGKTTVAAIADDKELQLVGESHRKDNLKKCIHAAKAELVIDFTILSLEPVVYCLTKLKNCKKFVLKKNWGLSLRLIFVWALY